MSKGHGLVTHPGGYANVQTWHSWFKLLACAMLVVVPAAHAAPQKQTRPTTRPAASKPVLLIQAGHSDSLETATFVRNGRNVLTAGDKTAKLWDPQGRVLSTYSIGTSAEAAAMSPDGRLIMVAGTDGQVRGFDTATAQLKFTTKVNDYRVYALAFAPDGSWFVAVGDGGAVTQLAPDGTQKAAVKLTGERALKCVAISADGSRIAVGDDHGNVTLLASSPLAPSLTIKAHKDTDVHGVAFSGDCVASASSDQTVALWSLTGQELKRTSLNPDPDTLKVWSGYSVSFSPDGKLLAIATNNEVQILDASTLARLRSVVGDSGQITGVEFHPDGNTVIAAGNNGAAYVYEASTLKLQRTLVGNTRAALCLAVSKDGTLLASGGWDNAVKIWNLSSGKVVRTLEGFGYGVDSLAFHPDGHLLAVGTGDWHGQNSLTVWDIKSGKKILEPRHSGDAPSIAFSPNGESFIAAQPRFLEVLNTSDGKVKVRLERGKELLTTKSTGGHVVAYNPQGNRIATALGKDISLWHASSGKYLGVMEGPRRTNVLAFSPDGQKLVAAGEDGKVVVYDWDSQVKLYDKTVNEREIWAMSISPDARLLATGDETGSIVLSKLADMKPVATIRAHNGGVSDLAFIRGGQALVSSSTDTTLKFWKVDSRAHLATALELNFGKDWVVTTPDGLFDGSSGGQKLIEWRIGETIFALDQFFNDFYTPGLLAQVLPSPGSRTLPPRAQLDITRMKAPPHVAIVSPKHNERSLSNVVTVQVGVEDRGGGFSRPRLFHNGHRLPDKAAKGQRGSVISYEVELVEGVNYLRATAFNGDGTVESRGSEVTFYCDAPARRKPVLHLVAVGVDKYQAGLTLNFARADARAIASYFKPGLFESVETTLLLDEKATRRAVLQALAEVGNKAAPRDAVLVYLAGHGTLVGDLFYYLPWDVKIQTDDQIRDTGISSAELAEALASINATKQVVVLDACHSGASTAALGKLVASRDALGLIRAQQRLARSSGTFLIAAATAQQYALEVPELGHGVLTYAILHGLGEKGAPAAPVNADGQVTVNSLLRFLSDQVPQLTEKYQGVRQDVVQFSTGQDFPLVVK